jgi:hypothetical protein
MKDSLNRDFSVSGYVYLSMQRLCECQDNEELKEIRWTGWQDQERSDLNQLAGSVVELNIEMATCVLE